LDALHSLVFLHHFREFHFTKDYYEFRDLMFMAGLQFSNLSVS
jgi:hypothetical protein